MDRREANALDRHITGNYGEDQFPEERELCDDAHDLVFIGNEPLDYDDPDSPTQSVYTCRGCGDLYEGAYKKELLQ